MPRNFCILRTQTANQTNTHFLEWSFHASRCSSVRDIFGRQGRRPTAASAGAAPPPAAMRTAVAPTAGEAAALPPVPALPTPQELDHVGSFYAKCLAVYDARNHKGTSGRATACDTHRVYAIAYLAARCAVREARERRRERNEDGSNRVASERRS